MNKEEASKSEEYKNYIETLPKKRMAAGLIIRDSEKRILLVTPSYKTNLEIPGGVVEKNESPYEACKREVFEELGLQLNIERMLCVDYNQQTDRKTESLMFIFYGGEVSKEIIEKIKVDGKEIVNYQFMHLEEINGKTTSSLYNRIRMSVEAIENQKTYYLENQILIS